MSEEQLHEIPNRGHDRARSATSFVSSYVVSASARRPRSQRRRHVNNVNPQQAKERDSSSLR